jgi:hypothetical protein
MLGFADYPYTQHVDARLLDFFAEPAPGHADKKTGDAVRPKRVSKVHAV